VKHVISSCLSCREQHSLAPCFPCGPCRISMSQHTSLCLYCMYFKGRAVSLYALCLFEPSLNLCAYR
jgi:hypothetical protein